MLSTEKSLTVMSASLPVVWCADRNSVNSKPTAFELQGIHLQGNINEQHVLAVREFINAASEGRLLLPSDGGIVLLSCGGTEVGSLIVSSNERNKDCVVKDKEIKTVSPLEKDFRDQPIFSINNGKSESLYEFLCCARCMSEGAKCCNNNGGSGENLKIIEKYLDAKTNAGKITTIRRVSCHHKPIKHRRKNKCSFKSENRVVVVVVKRVGRFFPIYATVNKPKSKNKISGYSENRERKNNVTDPPREVFLPNPLNDSFRKTSFDSTCTINSVDSGFIEMQSKVLRSIKKKSVPNSVQVNIEAPKEEEKKELIIEQHEKDTLKSTLENLSSWNRLTVPQQSRNRRKSYEEFKSLFCDQKNNLDVTSLGKSRRKSYEEFKSGTNLICFDSNNNLTDLTTIKNNLKSPNDGEVNSSNNFITRLRRGSKRFSQRSVLKNSKNCNQEVNECKIYDILRHTENEKNPLKEHSEKKQINYVKNLELFESHCKSENNSQKKINSDSNKSSFNDNFKSFGTIYDIIQKRCEMSYVKEGKKYDKYMTYGTLYEILHRKSDEGELLFDRKRTFSEKFSSTQRMSYDKNSLNTSTTQLGTKKSLFENSPIIDNVTDTSSRHLNSSDSSGSMKQGSCIANNQLSITSANGKQLSTIYDILQTKKLDTAVGIIAQPSYYQNRKNRFLVRKITEEELFELQNKETQDHCNKSNYGDPINAVFNNVSDQHAITTNKMQTKLRRFSNILSYSPNKICNVSNNSESVDLNSLEGKKDMQKLSNASIDDIYSRLNGTNLMKKDNSSDTLLQCNERGCSLIKNKLVINKSSSMDNMLKAVNEEENKEFCFKNRLPMRKISVPTHLPPKIFPKKNTRRLSEFTRGEFLNEKL